MLRNVREPIRVAVIFGSQNGVQPVWFDWGSRKYEVRKITYSWRERIGDVTLLHFAVSDGANLFEIVYDVAGQGWHLAAVDDEARLQGEKLTGVCLARLRE